MLNYSGDKLKEVIVHVKTKNFTVKPQSQFTFYFKNLGRLNPGDLVNTFKNNENRVGKFCTHSLVLLLKMIKS